MALSPKTSTFATPKSSTGAGLAAPDAKHSIEGLIDRIATEIRGAVRHGHFDLTVSGAHARGEYVEVIVKAGKHYRFLIPKDSIQ